MPNVRPFSNGTEGYDWLAKNCDRCQKNGHAKNEAPCPMEEAVSMGFITGTVPSGLAVEYGATLSEDAYCDMPRQCSQFAPPATCEFIPRPKTRARRKCGKPASGTVEAHGLTQSVCAYHAKRCAEMDAEEAATPLVPPEGR